MHPGVTYKVRICENVWKFVEDAPALLPYTDLLPAAPNSALDLDTDKGHSDCRSDKWTCNWKESTCFIVSFYKHPNILKCQHVLSLCEEAKMSKLIAAWHPRWGVADAPRIAAEVVQLGCLNHPFTVRTFCEPQTCLTFSIALKTFWYFLPSSLGASASKQTECSLPSHCLLRNGLSHPSFKDVIPSADGTFTLATADEICGLCSCLSFKSRWVD